MEISIQQLATLSGVSSRTLRYYDEINLLKPMKLSDAGYRIYGQGEVDLLQQILLYRELGFKLEVIKDIVHSAQFDFEKALLSHREKLLEERQRLDFMISNVEKSILSLKGEVMMTNEEKFEGFKKQMMEENEQQYGKEIREKYGNEAVEASYVKHANMTEEEFHQSKAIESEMIGTLLEAMKESNPSSEKAQKGAELHKEWLLFYWSTYSKEAHYGLAQMYVEDERFKAYYDQHQSGLANFLKEAISIYTGHSL